MMKYVYLVFLSFLFACKTNKPLVDESGEYYQEVVFDTIEVNQEE